MSKFWEDEIERLRTIPRLDAISELREAIYAAGVLIERLESAGRIVGNGHHIRQDIASYAAKKLTERLRDNERP